MIQIEKTCLHLKAKTSELATTLKFIGKNKSCVSHLIINCFKSVCYVPHIHINSLIGGGEYFGYSGSVG